MKPRIRSNILLFIAALIWGAAFVAQKLGAVRLGVFTFTTVRFFISGIALLPVALLRSRSRRQDTQTCDTIPADSKSARRALLLGGVFCGLCLVLAASAQQIGLKYTTAVKRVSSRLCIYCSYRYSVFSAEGRSRR